jgi:hypothetical protein
MKRRTLTTVAIGWLILGLLVHNLHIVIVGNVVPTVFTVTVTVLAVLIHIHLSAAYKLTATIDARSAITIV